MSLRGNFPIFAASSTSQSNCTSQWLGSWPPLRESLTLSGPLITAPEQFGCCREICPPPQTALHGGGRLAYNGMLFYIPKASFTALLHQCYADLATVAYTLL